MRVERILMWFIAILLLASIVVPIVILLLIKDKALAGQIGDTLGGTTAPLISISAILAVIATYIYQRRNDQKNVRREMVSENFYQLKSELNTINHVVTVTSKGEKEVTSYIGKEAIDYIIRALNNKEYTIDIRELSSFTPIINVYQYLNALIDDVIADNLLTTTEKKLFLVQFSLFYRNNLFISKQQRGDELCKHHNEIHQIPSELYENVINIERKLEQYLI